MPTDFLLSSSLSAPMAFEGGKGRAREEIYTLMIKTFFLHPTFLFSSDMDWIRGGVCAKASRITADTDGGGGGGK